jgi:hypothetical protein
MNSILSDYNRPGYTPSVTQTIRYADLDWSLRVLYYDDKQGNTIKGDIIPLTDIDAVKNSIRNLVLTSVFERPFEPSLSSRIRSLLFENVNPITALSLKEEIDTVIRKYEPRVAEVYTSITDDSSNNAYFVSVSFSISNHNPEIIEFIINRLR